MRKKITNNIPLKIISLLIGFLVWLLVVNIDNPIISRSFTIQNIEILNEAYIDDVLEDAGKVALRNAESPTVRVTITGERKNVNGITSGDIHLTADMQQALSLNTDPVMIPIVASCDKNGVASITVSPPNLSVKLEDKATSTFPVTVNNGDSRPGKGYEIGTQSVEPDSIRITGPYSLVKIIDKVNVTTSTTSTCRYPDLYWPVRAVDVEYQSDQDHSGNWARYQDARRQVELEAENVAVLPLTRHQVMDASEFNAFATTVRRMLGVRSRPLPSDREWRYDNLRRTVLGIR